MSDSDALDGASLYQVRDVLRVLFVSFVVSLVFKAFFQVSDFARLIALLGMYLVLVVYVYTSEPEYSIPMRTCMEYFTEDACSNIGRCEVVEKVFATDREWAAYRRNMCVESLHATKSKLYNSYDPERCEFWGDCEALCVDKLNEIRAEIDAYQCPDALEEAAGHGLMYYFNLFPEASTRVFSVMPLCSDQMFMGRLWAAGGILLCVVLLVSRGMDHKLFK